jgi:hypothetical protein
MVIGIKMATEFIIKRYFHLKMSIWLFSMLFPMINPFLTDIPSVSFHWMFPIFSKYDCVRYSIQQDDLKIICHHKVKEFGSLFFFPCSFSSFLISSIWIWCSWWWDSIEEST